MTHGKHRRGRPEVDDSELLAKIADKVLAKTDIKIAAALKSVVSRPCDATIHRIQEKWRKNSEALLLEAQLRFEGSNRKTAPMASSQSPKDQSAILNLLAVASAVNEKAKRVRAIEALSFSGYDPLFGLRSIDNLNLYRIAQNAQSRALALATFANTSRFHVLSAALANSPQQRIARQVSELQEAYQRAVLGPNLAARYWTNAPASPAP